MLFNCLNIFIPKQSVGNVIKIQTFKTKHYECKVYKKTMYQFFDLSRIFMQSAIVWSFYFCLIIFSGELSGLVSTPDYILVISSTALTANMSTALVSDSFWINSADNWS